jgi:hypothetical protein
MTKFENVGVFIRERVWLENSSESLGSGYFRANIFKPSHPSYLFAYEDRTDSVPKRRNIKFRRRGITQKKAYSIGNTAKV